MVKLSLLLTVGEIQDCFWGFHGRVVQGGTDLHSHTAGKFIRLKAERTWSNLFVCAFFSMQIPERGCLTTSRTEKSHTLHRRELRCCGATCRGRDRFARQPTWYQHPGKLLRYSAAPPHASVFPPETTTHYTVTKHCIWRQSRIMRAALLATAAAARLEKHHQLPPPLHSCWIYSNNSQYT